MLLSTFAWEGKFLPTARLACMGGQRMIAAVRVTEIVEAMGLAAFNRALAQVRNDRKSMDLSQLESYTKIGKHAVVATFGEGDLLYMSAGMLFAEKGIGRRCIRDQVGCLSQAALNCHRARADGGVLEGHVSFRFRVFVVCAAPSSTCICAAGPPQSAPVRLDPWASLAHRGRMLSHVGMHCQLHTWCVVTGRSGHASRPSMPDRLSPGRPRVRSRQGARWGASLLARGLPKTPLAR